MKKGKIKRLGIICVAEVLLLGVFSGTGYASSIADTVEGSAVETKEEQLLESTEESIEKEEEKQLLENETPDDENSESEASESETYENEISKNTLYENEASGNGVSENTEISVARAMFSGEKNQMTVTSDATERFFSVTLDYLSVSAAKGVKIAVWSDNKAQDDLRWYDATKSGDSWKVDIDVKNHHGDVGLYHAHAYADISQPKLQYVTETTFNVAGITRGTVSGVATDSPNGLYRVSLQGVSSPAGIEKAEFAVWSQKNGQDDLKWYTAQKKGDTWYADIDISNHKCDSGIYNVHPYVYDTRGGKLFAGSTQMNVSEMRKDVFEIRLNASQTQAVLKLKNFSRSDNADYVSFAVWGKSNGQNDLKWYKASQISDHTYQATVNISNHKEWGQYAAHVYYQNGRKSVYVKEDNFTVSGISGGNMQIVNLDKKEGYFDVCITGLKSPATISKVLIPVWSENKGQDDLIWHEASYRDGKWSVRIDIGRHYAEIGKYQVHVYAEDNRGIRQYITEKQVNVPAVSLKPAVTVVTNPGGVTATATMTNIIGATDVQVPVWGKANGQNDIVWYDAKKTGDRTWQATIELGNHMELGSYAAHVYSTVNGVKRYACETVFNVDKISSDIVTVYDQNDTYGRFSVKIQNVSRSNQVKAVQFAVWSDYKGQDDLIWYNAAKNGNTWSVHVDSKDHNFYDTGKYHIHIYAVDASGKQRFIKQTSTDVKVTAKLGFIAEGGETYYYEDANVKARGFRRLAGYLYYFNPSSGAMATGWNYVDGYKYYFGHDGRLVQDVTSILGLQSSYKLEINKAMNCVTLYAFDPATGHYCVPVRSMRCCTGAATPLGTYNLRATYRWLRMYNGTYCQYCTLITGEYLIHSITYDVAGNIYTMSNEGYNALALGIGRSAGCVRLQCGEAYDVYNLVNMGRLRTVQIYNNTSSPGPFDIPHVSQIPAGQTWDPTDPLI